MLKEDKLCFWLYIWRQKAYINIENIELKNKTSAS